MSGVESSQYPVASSTRLRRYAVMTAGSVLLLILAGGFVTTTGTGDSISEWPLLWGNLQAGFPIEWTHRVLAMIVSLMTAGLALWAYVARASQAVRTLALIALFAILVQAALGGVRIYVPDDVYPTYRAIVAIVHASFAQIVFCIFVAVAAFLSRGWIVPERDEEVARARTAGLATVGVVFFQLVAGAITRHTGSAVWVHLVGAMVVLSMGALFGSRLAATSMNRGGLLLIGLLALQLLLGLLAWGIRNSGFVRSHESPLGSIVIVTAHVAMGALVLATALVLTMRCFRARVSGPAPVVSRRAEEVVV